MQTSLSWSDNRVVLKVKNLATKFRKFRKAMIRANERNTRGKWLIKSLKILYVTGLNLTSWFNQVIFDLVHKFVSHYEYNIENDASMIELCNMKQRTRETFANFLQGWRHLIRKFPQDIPISYQVELFQCNLFPEMSHPLSCQCLETFEEVTKNGLSLDRVLLEQGILRPYQKNSQGSSSNDKSRYWSKNKNIVNDGVTNTKCVQVVTILTKPTTTNN